MKRLILLILLGALALSPVLAFESEREKKEIASGDADMIVWRWVNFAMLAAVIVYYGIKLGNPYFSGRTREITQGLDEARDRRSEAERRSAEVQRKLDNLGAEIEQFSKTARVEQSEQVERIRRQFALDAERAHASAGQQIESVAKYARLELQRHASRIALDLADQQLRSRMNPSLQHGLTARFVRDIQA